MPLADSVSQVVVTTNDRFRLPTAGELRATGTPYMELLVPNRAGDTLGGGTATLVYSVEDKPDPTNAAHWQTYNNDSGVPLTLSLGRSYAIQSRVPALAVSMAGATSPSLTIWIV